MRNVENLKIGTESIPKFFELIDLAKRQWIFGTSKLSPRNPCLEVYRELSSDLEVMTFELFNDVYRITRMLIVEMNFVESILVQDDVIRLYVYCASLKWSDFSMKNVVRKYFLAQFYFSSKWRQEKSRYDWYFSSSDWYSSQSGWYLSNLNSYRVHPCWI